ncbi:MAG: hypothetical protein VYE68_07900 [Acidobacteriota bacterium]|nr:hypothetical protein [Acidobacteriota bacterium]
MVIFQYGEWRRGAAVLDAHDKTIGEGTGTVEIPASTNTAIKTFVHDGVQHRVAPIRGQSGRRAARGGAQHPGVLGFGRGGCRARTVRYPRVNERPRARRCFSPTVLQYGLLEV